MKEHKEKVNLYISRGYDVVESYPSAKLSILQHQQTHSFITIDGSKKRIGYHNKFSN